MWAAGGERAEPRQAAQNDAIERTEPEQAVAFSQSLSSSSTADSDEVKQDVASDSCTESRLESRSNSKVSAVSVLETESYESIRRKARGTIVFEAERCCEDDEERRPASARNEGDVEGQS